MSCLTFIILASMHSICSVYVETVGKFFALLKASPWDWQTVESRSFTFFNVPFNFSTIPLCSLMDKFSFLPSLGGWASAGTLAWKSRPPFLNSHPHRKFLLFVSSFCTTLRTWFSMTMQELGKTLFQATVTSVKLKSLQMSTMRRGRTIGSF